MLEIFPFSKKVILNKSELFILMHSMVQRNLWQNVGDFVDLQAELSMSNWGTPWLAGCFLCQMPVSVVCPC